MKKSMLYKINLEIINDIFINKSKIKLKASTQSFYINCLIKKFKSLEINEENSKEFSISKQEFPNYEKWHSKVLELSEAGLVEVEKDQIKFIDNWSNLIDLGIDLNESNEHPEFSMKKEIVWFSPILNSQSFIESCSMKFRLKGQLTKRLLFEFVEEQSLITTKYYNEEEVKRHFINWLPKKLEKLKSEPPKSQNRLLGSE